MTDEARAYALRLLAQRSYPVMGLRRKLIAKEFSPEDADAVIDRLKASGLLNDEQFAAAYARAKLTSSSASPRRVQQHLARKGISASIAAAAVESVIREEEIDVEAVLEKVARKKAASFGDLDAHVKKRRLLGFLARRGYDLDDIRRVAARVLR
jgi:regulatory protein